MKLFFKEVFHRQKEKTNGILEMTLLMSIGYGIKTKDFELYNSHCITKCFFLFHIFTTSNSYFSLESISKRFFFYFLGQTLFILI